MDVTALQQLHFIRPWLLLLLVPLAVLLVAGRRRLWRQGSWSSVVDAPLLQLMLGTGGVASRRRLWLLASFWLLAVLALAGPTWRQLPQPVYQSQAARIILMDLSLSMDAGDVSPSRLTRAKHKLLDLLDKSKDGETGLVVYAGDAFVISPLTSDAKTISALVPPLSTRIMPALGSRPDLGLDKALELLRNAGRAHGEILWITDGATKTQLQAMSESLRDSGYPLSILAIGTRQGAPIELQEGFLKDASGAIVMPRLDYQGLANFARANDARLIRLAADNSDIEYLLAANRGLPLDAAARADDLRADAWEDGGVWLTLLLLPLALAGFRRGHGGLPALLLVGAGLGLAPAPAQAGIWQDLWQRPDQQGEQVFEEDPEQAAQLFNDPAWQGSAAYRAGDYETAARAFAEKDSALSSYNRGNALAQLGDFDQAIAAYEQALDQNPPFREDVEANLDLIRNLKQQQEQQQQDQQDSEQQNQEQGDSSSSPQDGGQDSEQQQDPGESGQQDQQPDAENPEQTGEAESAEPPGDSEQQPTPQQQLDARESEEKDQELEQWLRRIPDDPGGLLRRKMYREYLKRRDESQEEKIW